MNKFIIFLRQCVLFPVPDQSFGITRYTHVMMSIATITQARSGAMAKDDINWTAGAYLTYADGTSRQPRLSKHMRIDDTRVFA